MKSMDGINTKLPAQLKLQRAHRRHKKYDAKTINFFPSYRRPCKRSQTSGIKDIGQHLPPIYLILCNKFDAFCKSFLHSSGEAACYFFSLLFLPACLTMPNE